MGKSVNKRKVRWRALQLSDINIEPNNHGAQEMIADNINGNHSASREYNHQNGYSHEETNGDKKPHFNEDDYTKITTPRQDVLLKKDYINRRKYLNNTNNGSITLPLMNSGYNTTVTATDLDATKQPLSTPSTVEFIDPGVQANPAAACYDNGLNGTAEYDDGYGYYGPGIAATPAAPQGTYFDSNNGILYATTAPALCLISPFYNPAFIPTNLQTINTEQYNEAAGTVNGNGDYEETKVVGHTDDECDLSSMSSATSATLVAVTETATEIKTTTTTTTKATSVAKVDTINENGVSIGTTVFRVDAEEFIPQSMRNQQQQQQKQQQQQQHHHKSTSTDSNYYEVHNIVPQSQPAHAATPVPTVASSNTNDKSNKKRQQSITILQSPNRKPETTNMKSTVQPTVKKSQQTPIVLKSKEALIVEPKNVIVTSGTGSSKKPTVTSDDWIAVSNRKRRSQMAQQKSVETDESGHVAVKKIESFEIPPIESAKDEQQIKKPLGNSTNKNTKKKQKKTTNKPATPTVEVAKVVSTTTTVAKETVKMPVTPVQKSLDRETEQRPTPKRPNTVNTPSTPPPLPPNQQPSLIVNSGTPVQQKDNKRKAKKKSLTAVVNKNQQQSQASEHLPVTSVSDVTISDEFDSRTNVEISEEIEREIQRYLENEVECRLKSINLDSKDDEVKVPTFKLPLKTLTHSSQFGVFGQTNSILAFPQLPSILTNKAIDISFKNNHNFKETRTTQAPSSTAPSTSNINNSNNNSDLGLPCQTLTTMTTTTTSTTTSTMTKTEPTETMSVTINGSIAQPLVMNEAETETKVSEPIKMSDEQRHNVIGSDISSTVRNWFSNHHGVKALKTPQQLHTLRTRVQQQLCPEFLKSQSAPRSTLKSNNSSGFLTAASHVACTIT